MKKILAIVLAVVMLLPVFAVNVFAAEEVEKPLEIVINDFKENGTVVDGVAAPVAGKDRFQVALPNGLKDGDKVKLHIVGECNEAFRFWLADGWSGCSAVVTSAAVGIPTGAFDTVIELTATGVPAGVIFGANPSGGNFDSFKLTALSIYEEAEPKKVAYEYKESFEFPGNSATLPVLTDDGSKGRPSCDGLEMALGKKGAELEVTVTTTKESEVELILQHGDSWSGWTTFAKEKVNGEKTFSCSADALTELGIDLKQIRALVVNGADPFTVKSIKVSVPAPKKNESRNFAFIYVTNEYHAVLVGGRFLAMPHQEILGYCPMCHAFIETEAADKSVLVLETTGGQDYQDTPGVFADGVALVDATEGKDNARIATSWVGGGAVWNSILKALPTEGAWLKITYTGKLNSIAFQTEKTSAPEAFEITTPAVVEEGDQNVAWFNCADIVANSPVALSGSIGGWANFMLNFEGDTTVYGFEVLVPAEAPTAE